VSIGAGILAEHKARKAVRIKVCNAFRKAICGQKDKPAAAVLVYICGVGLVLPINIKIR
jgi:hypothetical protein